MMIDVYYSAKEVIKILNISLSTLDRLVRKKELVPDWAGHQRRFSKTELLRYLDEERKKHENNSTVSTSRNCAE